MGNRIRTCTRRRPSEVFLVSLAALLVAVAAVRAQPDAEAYRPAPGAGNDFGIACWLPYWKKHEGAAALLEHLELFEQVSPFSFRVQKEGALEDTVQIAKAPWPKLLTAAGRQGVAVFPTLVWFKAPERAHVLADPEKRDRHIEHIVELARRRGFSGVDIDYERKTLAEREDFSRFLTRLSRRLHAQDRRLSCTIEPRTSDEPPADVSGQGASPWANEYRVLDRVCDQVRVMAYDRWSLQAARHGRRGRRPPSHAGLGWVEQVVRYTVSRIHPRKLYLGIPTYGWEFEEQNRSGRKVYRRVRARSYAELAARIRSVNERERGPGGELHLRDGKRLVVMPDALAIGKLIDLARRHGLRGVVLFKMDGQEDAEMWRVLHRALPVSAR